MGQPFRIAAAFATPGSRSNTNVIAVVASAMPAVIASIKSTLRTCPNLFNKAFNAHLIFLRLGPRHVGDAESFVCKSRRHEQQIRKPVEVNDHRRVYLLRF